MLYNHQVVRQNPRDNLPIINLNITEKMRYFLTHNPPDTPFLLLDLDVILRKLLNIRYFFSFAKVYYAIKANSARSILKMLVKLGTNFDTASIPEIKQCLQAGAKPLNISFGNTIKKEKDIAEAYKLGVRLFCFDSQPELEKIARSAPGSKVYCRILTENQGAEWPLSKKFGCEVNMAENLLLLSAKLGLEPLGVSFHVGSQQTDPNQWDGAIAKVAQLFARLTEHQVNLKMINLGGGFPAHYCSPILPEKNYAEAIIQSLHKYFGVNLPEVMIEPGRSLVADAGVIQTEVILISYKSESDLKRWIFLDIGKFGGLIETLDESIKYRICTPYDGQPTGPVILAGPTCDSADILYEKSCYELPLALKIGDRLSILSTGAYTHSYSSISFNGFPPLKVYCI
jgi:ornithine decarboxylase